MSEKRIKAEHGVIYSRGNDTLFGYFAWPSVCRIGEHKLMAAASGFRTGHVDPFGKSVCFYSEDDGRTWSEPEIVNNSPIDDRDAGLTDLGNGRALLSWVTSDTRPLVADKSKDSLLTRRYRMNFAPILTQWDEAVVAANVGSFVRIREADGTWGDRRYALVSAPHGPIKLRDGRLFYLGSEARYYPAYRSGVMLGDVAATVSADEGASWELVSRVKRPDAGMWCEPHALELPNGEILGMLRYEFRDGRSSHIGKGARYYSANHKDFSIYSVRSADGGKSWSEPVLITSGSPPSLMMHSSGVIVLSYSWRRENPGQRLRFSKDGGKSWSDEWILRDDGPDYDLGYPSTVELADGTLYTVYYQKTEAGALNCSFLSSHWELPKF